MLLVSSTHDLFVRALKVCHFDEDGQVTIWSVEPFGQLSTAHSALKAQPKCHVNPPEYGAFRPRTPRE